MNVDLFDFDLPPERIALRPAAPRDAARMLVLDGDGDARPAVSAICPAQLRARRPAGVQRHARHPGAARRQRGDARIGATLHKREGPRRWRAFVRNAKRLRDGDAIDFGAGVIARPRATAARTAASRSTSPGDEPVELLLERAGRMPLPPYIAAQARRPTRATPTIIRRCSPPRTGAVAAPTAALHFTPELMAALDEAGIGHATLTLHVGAGTFLPVKADDTDRSQDARRMGPDRRRHRRPPQRGARRRRPGDRGRHHQPAPDRKRGRRGRRRSSRSRATPRSSSRRAIASAAIDGLMTNFHLPRSTLFMLVSALMGLERMQAAYAHAIENGYRFYSYGDASLLLP